MKAVASRGLLTLVALLFCALALQRFAVVASQQLGSGYDLAYESPTLATIELIRKGENIYDEGVYAGYPYIITIYNPLYHYLVAFVSPGTSSDLFVARLVSLLAAVGFACMLAAKAAGDARLESQRLPVALLPATGFFLVGSPILQFAAYAKPDFPGLLCAGLAVFLYARARHSRSALVAMVALSAAAFLFKQSYMAGILAITLLSWIGSRRLCLAYVSLLVGVLSIWFAAAAAWYGEGYFFSTVKFHFAHALEAGYFATTLASIAWNPAFILMAGTSLFALLWLAGDLRAEDEPVPADAIYPLYFIISTVLFLAGVGKPGAGPNYAIEPLASGCLLLAATLGRRRELARGVTHALLAFCALGAIIVATVRPDEVVLRDAGASEKLEQVSAIARREYQEVAGDAQVVISLNSHQHARVLGLTASFSDPYAFWHAWDRGILPVSSIIDDLDAQRFDLVLMQDNSRNHFSIVLPVGLGKTRVEVIDRLLANYRLKFRGVFDYYVRK